MNLTSAISRTSPFPIVGGLDGIFHFFANLTRKFCKQTMEILILGLHCLPIPQKKDFMLIWVKQMVENPPRHVFTVCICTIKGHMTKYHYTKDLGRSPIQSVQILIACG